MPNFPYQPIGTELGRNLRNAWNKNLQDIESDIKELNGAQLGALEAATSANTAASNVNTAINNANTATDNAITATANANTATNNANIAINNAITATDDANTLVANTKYNEPYNAVTTYHQNNIVSFNGSSYISKVDNNVGNTPPDPSITIEDLNWALLSKKGQDGIGTVVIYTDVFTSSAGQTIFTLNHTYDQFQNRTSVTVGRVPQSTPDNYEETTSSSITLSEGVPEGTKVIVKYFSESVPLQSDIQTTVDNHTTVISDHTLRLNNHDTTLNDHTIQLEETTQSIGIIIDSYQIQVPEVDDTARFQRAIDATPSGGKLKLSGTAISITSVAINKPMSIEGLGHTLSIIEIANTLNNKGIIVTSDYVNFNNVKIKSKGTKTDGLNIIGVYYDDGSGSIGYNTIKTVIFEGFSGYGLQMVNAIDVTIEKSRAISCNLSGLYFSDAYGIYGTTISLRDLYISSCTEAGIKMYNTHQFTFERVIVEGVKYGYDLNKCGGGVFINSYFESINTKDIKSLDSAFVELAPGRADKGNDIQWSVTSAGARTISSLTDDILSTRSIVNFYEKGLSEKTITPYQYLNDNKVSMVDGLVYDNFRALSIIHGNNLLKVDGWNFPFEPNTKAISFKNSSGGTITRTMTQTINLAAGNYQFIAMLKNKTDNIELFRIKDSSNNVVALFQPDSLAYYQGSIRRFIYLPFTISTVGDYIMEFTSYGSSVDIDIYPILTKANGDITDRNGWNTSSFDEAMVNSFVLNTHLSNLANGYNSFGSGKKEDYGSTVPTTGIWKVGDRRHNTIPTAGGYMGWVCVTAGDFAGTPPIFKGFGLIQA